MELGSLFHRSLNFIVWHRTCLTCHTLSNHGSCQTSAMFKGTIRVILPSAHCPRIQKSVVKGIPHPEVTCKPLNLIIMK